MTSPRILLASGAASGSNTTEPNRSGTVQGISNSCVSTTLRTSPTSSEQLTGGSTALVSFTRDIPGRSRGDTQCQRGRTRLAQSALAGDGTQ